MSVRAAGLILLAALLAAGEPAAITTSIIAGAEVAMVAVPAGWSSAIVPAAGRDAFAQRPELALINGGYFDAAGLPDGLVVSGTARSGRLRSAPPYSGFVWADAAGAVRIARTAEPPAGAAWAIQTGPLLVEHGVVGIDSSTSMAPRSVIALRGEQVLLIRSGRIGLRELAEGLAAAGIGMAINLDGGPSSALLARVGAATLARPGTARVPYLLGFSPPGP